MPLGPVSDTLIKQAVSADTVESRALATQAIGRLIRDADLSDTQRRLSETLFDILSQDVCEEVRRALAITLRLSDNLPREVANRLIADIDTIAAPILSSSPVVTDEDLIAVLRSRAANKVRAIAERRGLSRQVSAELIDTNDRPAIAVLAANDSALISRNDAARLVELSSVDDLILEASLRRHDMPQDLAVRLIDLQAVSVEGALTPHTQHAATLTQDTASRAKAGWATSEWSAQAMNAYVTAMMSKRTLTEDVLARAAGQGDWRFVQVALAHLAQVTPAKAAMMVLDTQSYGLSALMRRARMGEAAQTLLLASADAYNAMERSGSRVTRSRFQRTMAERIATHPAADRFGELWLDWLDEGLGPRAVPI
ncbi:DUF2336 domain-containing protein [Algimonas porphyrae]|uniref:DUF2336 domain-containing protein n=1 Tax=Algimonas porphyrae TaxID=1128113 RepID=A0ABQ5UXS1_9PROT|nr:DUF2336 domain-containing protein [Algimonas porphyrae]GLQ20100.1 hypothetical protein GCM10007854_10550 [Algimonas porphyrae]